MCSGSARPARARTPPSMSCQVVAEAAPPPTRSWLGDGAERRPAHASSRPASTVVSASDRSAGVERRASPSARSASNIRASTRAWLEPTGGGLPIHPRPVQPAVVVGMLGVSRPRGVVEHRDLVAHVQQGYAAERVHDGVQQLQPRQGGVHASASPVSLNADSSPTSDAADPDVRTSPVAGLHLEVRAAREGTLVTAGVERREEASMLERVDADRPGILVTDRPTDVVVTAARRSPNRCLVAACGGVAGPAPGAGHHGKPAQTTASPSAGCRRPSRIRAGTRS